MVKGAHQHGSSYRDFNLGLARVGDLVRAIGPFVMMAMVVLIGGFVVHLLTLFL